MDSTPVPSGASTRTRRPLSSAAVHLFIDRRIRGEYIRLNPFVAFNILIIISRRSSYENVKRRKKSAHVSEQALTTELVQCRFVSY